MKRIVVLTILAWLVLPGSVAEAHVLKSNGTVGAVMHVTPDDDPIAGQESSFYFEFKDTEGKFKPTLCECTVRIKKAGREIYTQPLFSANTDPSLSNTSFSYTFPEKNIYTLTIEGKPTIVNGFTPFTLSYDLRVDRTADTEKETNDATLLPKLVLIFLLITVGAGIFFMKKRKHTTREEEVRK